MSDTFPIAIIQDRYGGVYSGGEWLAIANADSLYHGLERVIWCLRNGPHGADMDARDFWASAPGWIAAANSPSEASGRLRGSG